MTILLGRRCDRDPTTCCVCGRRAMSVGHAMKAGAAIAWSCGAPECLEVGKRIFGVKNLDRYEEKAITEAGGQVFDLIADGLLGAMWSNGVRSLEEMDADKFKAVAASAQRGPEFKRAFVQFLAAYGASIRSQLAAGDPPF